MSVIAGMWSLPLFHDLVKSQQYKHPQIVPWLLSRYLPKNERLPLTINFDCIVPDTDINVVFSFSDLKRSAAIYALQKHHEQTLRQILMTLTHDARWCFMHTEKHRDIIGYRLHLVGQDFNDELEQAYQKDKLLSIDFHPDPHQLMDALLEIIDCELAAELTENDHTPISFRHKLMEGFEDKLEMYLPMAERYLNLDLIAIS